MSIRANAPTAPTDPTAAPDRLRRVLESGRRLATPQAPQAGEVPTAMGKKDDEDDKNDNGDNGDNGKNPVEKPSFLSALELMLRPSGPPGAPTSPPYSPTSPSYNPGSNSPSYSPTSPTPEYRQYAWDISHQGPFGTKAILSWHFWLKGGDFNEATVEAHLREAFRSQVKVILPSMFDRASVGGDEYVVSRSLNVAIPIHGIGLLDLATKLKTDALVIRMSEREYNAVDAEGIETTRRLKYTLVQFQMRIERWLGDELLSVGLLGNTGTGGTATSLPPLNAHSMRMARAFKIYYPFVTTRVPFVSWRTDVAWLGRPRERPMAFADDPHMTPRQYDDLWEAPRFDDPPSPQEAREPDE